VLGIAAPSAAYAQPPGQQRGPGPNAIHLLVVPAFVSADKLLGCTVANEVRDRLDGDVDTKVHWITPQHAIEETLKASGFPPCQPVSATDNKQLSQQMRAEAYIDGTAAKTATGTHVEPKLVLARDLWAVQPLPAVDAVKIGDVAKQVSKEVLAAMKQYDGEEKCYNAARGNNYAAAITAARQAIAVYPQAALARLCIANALVAMKAPADSILPVTLEILKDDPHNHRALELSAQAYYDKKDYENAVKGWGGLIAADPSNTILVEDVVTKIVQSGRADAAVPIVAQALKDNPDDPKLSTLYCRILLAAKHNKEAPAACETATKTDTAFADTLYFQRVGAAYMADSQPQKAAETFAHGLAKFSSSVTLMQLGAQANLAAGQTQAAIDLLHKLLQIAPKTPSAWEQLYTAQLGINQDDSAFASAHSAVANGEDPGKMSSFVLPRANFYFKAANASKNADTSLQAIKWAKYADSLAASPAAKFIAGTMEFQLGLAADQEGAKAKSCDMVKKAQTYWLAASPDLHGGGSTSPAAAAQMLGLINQYMPAIEKQITALCKPAPK